jgi:hypothetical protein
MFRVALPPATCNFLRMSLRILHIDMGKAWRGGQRQVYLLARAQRDAGHEPIVVAPPDSLLLRRARGAGLAVSAVGAAGDWDLRAAGRVAQRLRPGAPTSFTRTMRARTPSPLRRWLGAVGSR